MDRMTAIFHRVETAQLESVMMLDGRRLSPLFVVKNENIAFPFTPNHRIKYLSLQITSPSISGNLSRRHNERNKTKRRMLRVTRLNHSTLDRHLSTYWLTAAGWSGRASAVRNCSSEILESCAIRGMRLWKWCMATAAVYKKPANNVRFRCRYIQLQYVSQQWAATSSNFIISSARTNCIHYGRQLNELEAFAFAHSLTQPATSVDNQSLGDELWILMISNLK